MREREGLIARIRQIRRVAATPDASYSRPPGDLDEGRMRALETRVAHLEELVEGLQDSVHRESRRHRKMIEELQAQIKPEAISASLAEDARNRGL